MFEKLTVNIAEQWVDTTLENRNNGFRSKGWGWKLARFGIFSALGVGVGTLVAGPLGAAAGIALGAIDTFAVDKLVTKRGPSTFVADLKDVVRAAQG